MNEQQSALAYGRAYQLFSQIFQHGLTGEIASILSISTDQPDTHFGAEHYQLFVHHVFPYETIFLDSDGLLGGAITEKVSAFYHKIGFSPSSGESADHISSEFDAIVHLCLAELDAIEDNLPHQMYRLRQLQRQFLDEHLLRWLPIFTVAVQTQAPTVYTNLVIQAYDLVCAHRTHLADDLMAQSQDFILDTPPNILHDTKTSLRDIARFLLTPAYTGFFLSVYNIRQLGAQYNVPHGFGKRQQILTNLLRTASDYDVFNDVLGEFRSLAITYQNQLKSMTQLSKSRQQIWLDRLQNTITLITQLQTLAINQKIIMDDELTDGVVGQGQPTVGCAVTKDDVNDTTC